MRRTCRSWRPTCLGDRTPACPVVPDGATAFATTRVSAAARAAEGQNAGVTQRPRGLRGPGRPGDGRGSGLGAPARGSSPSAAPGRGRRPSTRRAAPRRSPTARPLGSEATYVRTDVTRDDDVGGRGRSRGRHVGQPRRRHQQRRDQRPHEAVADYTPEEWNQVMAVNLNGIFHGIRHEMPQMVAQGRRRDRQHVVGRGARGLRRATGVRREQARGARAHEGGRDRVRATTACASTRCARAARGHRCSRASWRRARHREGDGAVGADRPARADPRRSPRRWSWLCSDAASFVVGHAFAVDGGAVSLTSHPRNQLSPSQSIRLVRAAGRPSDSDGSCLSMWPMRPL